MRSNLRVFLDTSAILAGLNSSTGAAGAVLGLCSIRDIQAVISPQIIEEAERNIEKKFPLLLLGWESFLMSHPEITPEPSLGSVRKAREILPTSDAPILAAAQLARLNYFVTWNTRDFLRRDVVESVRFSILTPGDFLKEYRTRDV